MHHMDATYIVRYEYRLRNEPEDAYWGELASNLKIRVYKVSEFR